MTRNAGSIVLKAGTLVESPRHDKNGDAGSAPGRDISGDAPGRDVLEGVRRGDPAAMAEFFEWSFDRVYSLAVRLLGDRATAQDVTQDVFVKIQQAAGRLDPERDPMPWVTAILYNACRDHWRSRGHKVSSEATPIDEMNGHAEAPASAAPDPEEAALSAEREREIEAALMRLPEDLRVVVVLRDYHGMRHEKIAGIVDSSEAAVRKRYSRALSRLAEELKEYWHE